ncbi:DUF3278 domain-containing protein [Convivina praedatoris]|uniref:DUF3278 domain-containing protein n=1 Tax=Convivina praedatoris TaxID=2880963 RepID=A0ABM9D0Y6_9LACO|nr:DUF3278 domain-containing protein [Convivina sp. LMG 32447]CAH1852031.1 hypothetical protein LMG032447_00468 [Convivina sp. LMG 32447]CAH1852057.1 hypothetical protein R078138_00478 [Convivina sp. LMG 32447]CAH1852873.1 hypothetical protein R077815_00639 [Convivina sp. LMG 32447]
MKLYNRLYIGLLRWFYGIDGVIDEYKEQKLNKFGNIAFILLMIYLILSTFVTLLFWAKYGDGVLINLVLLNMAVFFVSALIEGFYVFKNKLDKTYSKSPDNQKKKYQRKAIRVGVFFGFWMYLSTGILDYIIDKTSLVNLLSIQSIGRGIIQGVFFGAFMYLMFKHRIDK